MHTFYLRRSRMAKVVVGLLLVLAAVTYLLSKDCAMLARYGSGRQWLVAMDVQMSVRQPVGQITMVTSMLDEELPYFTSIMANWTGPVSVAVYTEHPQDFVNSWNKHLELVVRQDISLHLVQKNGEYYPRNVLTNVALENALTEYVFLTDVIAVPCPSLYKRLYHYIHKLGLIKNRQWHQGLVVPVFEGNGDVPHTKAELVTKLKRGQVKPYKPTLTFDPSRMTNYPFWETALSPYETYYIKGYSPNIVLKRRLTPKCNTRILGKDFDTMSHHAELYVAGLRLSVLPDVYSVRRTEHKLHPLSKQMMDSAPDIRCTAEEFKMFRGQLEQRYCGQNTTIEPTKMFSKEQYCRKQQVWDMVDRIYKKAYQ